MERWFPVGWEAMIYSVAAMICVSMICNTAKAIAELVQGELRAWRHMLGKREP